MDVSDAQRGVVGKIRPWMMVVHRYGATRFRLGLIDRPPVGADQRI